VVLSSDDEYVTSEGESVVSICATFEYAAPEYDKPFKVNVSSGFLYTAMTPASEELNLVTGVDAMTDE
jgi:hypothetical protein